MAYCLITNAYHLANLIGGIHCTTIDIGKRRQCLNEFRPLISIQVSPVDIQPYRVGALLSIRHPDPRQAHVVIERNALGAQFSPRPYTMMTIKDVALLIHFNWHKHAMRADVIFQRGILCLGQCR